MKIADNNATKKIQLDLKIGRWPEEAFFLKHTDGQDTWKDAQCHSSLSKCKLKLQWNTTLYLSKWLLSTKQQIASTGEEVGKGPSCTGGWL